MEARFDLLVGEPLWGRAMQGFGRFATASRPYYPSRGVRTLIFLRTRFFWNLSNIIRLPLPAHLIINHFGKFIMFHLFQIMRKNLKPNSVRSPLGNSPRSKNFSLAERTFISGSCESAFSQKKIKPESMSKKSMWADAIKSSFDVKDPLACPVCKNGMVSTVRYSFQGSSNEKELKKKYALIDDYFFLKRSRDPPELF